MNPALRNFLLPALLTLASGPGLAQDLFEFESMPPHEVKFAAGLFPGDALPADPMHVVMLARRLDLKPDQRQAFGRIVDQAAPKLRDLMFRMQDTRKELDSAMEVGVKDEATLRKLADEQGRLHADLLFLQLSTRQKLHALLDEEQREKLEQGAMGWHGPMAKLRAHSLHRERDRPAGAKY